jgi:hypothetical protein
MEILKKMMFICDKGSVKIVLPAVKQMQIIIIIIMFWQQI